MRIWLVTVGEPVPADPGNPRLLRTGLLGEYLVAQGHRVVWWNSTFDHVRKTHRAASDSVYTLASGVHLRLLHGCGYRRNVSPRRILDHTLVARRFARLAVDEPAPDVLLASLPTLELALAAVRYGKARDIPVALDIRDLWPDYIEALAPPWARGIARLLLLPMARQADAACKGAAALTGNSPAFVEWGLRKAGRDAGDMDRVFPHAYPSMVFSGVECSRAAEFWDRLGIVDDGTFTVCFFGVFSQKCDLACVIDAAGILERAGLPMRVVLCGAGDDEDKLRRRAAGLKSVFFPGWVGAAEIQALMARSHAGLAPYRNKAGFVGNLPNKPIEYLAGGLPVVSCLLGTEMDTLYRGGGAVCYGDADAGELAAVLRELAEHPEERAHKAAAARDMFARCFSTDGVYGPMAAWLGAVADMKRCGKT